MTAFESSARSRRGIVLTVGQSPLIAALAQRLVHQPRRAANLFDAIGEVTLATAAEPVACVILSTDVLRDSPRTVVNAFRRVDPAVRLILLGASSDDPALAEARAAGFDECIGAELARLDLSRILESPIKFDDAPIDPPTAPPQPPVARPAVPATAPAPAPAPGSARTEWPQRAARTPQPPPAVLHSTPPPQTPASHPLTAPPRSGLGDIDLVEAILTRSGRLVDHALRLIIQQTGWSDLALVPTIDDESGESGGAGGAGTAAPGEAPHDSRGALVAFAGRTFGRLTASSASADQLRPWSDWLARWLALDRVHREYRTMAYRDDLTGAGTRRFFNLFLARAIKRGYETRQAVTVMVFDIDDFKLYNDRYGHDAGDEILRETVRLLNSVIRKGDRVFRIGGDEFAVVFADPEAPRELGSRHPETAEQIAARFQDQICRMQFPKLSQDAPGTLSISAGLATYPWDGHDPQSLLSRADQLALQSKRRGKNAISYGPAPRER